MVGGRWLVVGGVLQCRCQRCSLQEKYAALAAGEQRLSEDGASIDISFPMEIDRGRVRGEEVWKLVVSL